MDAFTFFMVLLCMLYGTDMFEIGIYCFQKSVAKWSAIQKIQDPTSLKVPSLT